MNLPEWLQSLLAAAGTVLVSLILTFLFNKIVGWPKELKRQREEAAAAQKAREEAERVKEEQHKKADAERDARIAAIESAISVLPSYRAQSLQIQQQLQSTDQEILTALTDIKDNMLTNREILNNRLDHLEGREKNSIRAKLMDEFRLFTDEHKNPMLAWSEMEHHAFFKLVEDYEGLHGNDYVHTDVLPAMNKLEVIPMNNKEALLKLMQSRRL
jgi:hypothetical protein